jgi:hypothetical protein
MADRRDRPSSSVAILQALEGLLIEDACDESEPLVERQPLTVADGDAGRLLPAMLERVKPEVREPCDRPARRPDADDAALLAGAPMKVLGLVDG